MALRAEVQAASDALGVDIGDESALDPPPLPMLPIELWLYALKFFVRSWWK